MIDARIMEKIEPYDTILAVARQFSPEDARVSIETKLLLSIAISAKRIADALETPRK